MASTTFVGQNYGAHNLRRGRSGANQALGISLGITATVSAFVMLFARPLLTLFTTDAEVLAYGVRFTLIISPFYLLICFNQIYASALRGIGNANMPMILMLLSFVGFRQLYLLASRWLGNPFVMVSLAYPAGWVMCSVLITICYRRSILFRAPAPTAA